MQSPSNNNPLYGKPCMSNPIDYSASVLARLLNHSRSHRETYQSLIIRYVIERFLYRLSQSEYRNSYVLKEAQLLTITLENQTYRTTKDIDLLKSGDTLSGRWGQL